VFIGLVEREVEEGIVGNQFAVCKPELPQGLATNKKRSDRIVSNLLALMQVNF